MVPLFLLQLVEAGLPLDAMFIGWLFGLFQPGVDFPPLKRFFSATDGSIRAEVYCSNHQKTHYSVLYRNMEEAREVLGRAAGHYRLPPETQGRMMLLLEEKIAVGEKIAG
jgi:hypothetical protein